MRHLYRMVQIALLVLFGASAAFSQTTVNLTVTDTPDNQLWANGTWSVKLQPEAGNSSQTNSFTLLSGGGSLASQNGTLSGTGTAAITLPANANIGPTSAWQFTVCPQASAGCFQQAVTVSTSSPQTLAINPPSIRINLTTATPPVSAYSTGEITQAVLGSQFFLIGTGQQFCTAVSGNSCTTWGGSGGISSPVLVNTSVDAFNRTGTGLGANWTAYLNSLNSTPGSVVGSTVSEYNLSAYTAQTTVRAQRSRVSIATLNGTTDFPGAAVEISGTPTTSVNFYSCTEGTTSISISRIVGASNASPGTTTGLATTAVSGVPGDVLELGIVGNTLTCTRNFANVLQVVDSTPIATGSPGMVVFGNVATMSSYAMTNPVMPAGGQVNIVFDGNSIIAANGNGSNGTDPASSFMYYTSPNAYVANLGVSAKCLGAGCAAFNSGTIETMLATQTTVVNPLFVPGVKNILFAAFVCTNDIANASRTTAQCLTDLTTYVTAAHAQGWKVIVVPEISRTATTTVATDVKLGIMRTLEVANSAGADAVVVLPTSVTGTGASQNAILFNSDQIHPTETFHIDILARAIIAALSKF